MHPQLTYILTSARSGELRRVATRHSMRNRTLRPVASARTVSLRLGLPSDEAALARLAAVDSATPPPQPVLLAELDGRLAAALALSDGSVIADPFQYTSDLIALLRARARQLHASRAA